MMLLHTASEQSFAPQIVAVRGYVGTLQKAQRAAETADEICALLAVPGHRKSQP